MRYLIRIAAVCCGLHGIVSAQALGTASESCRTTRLAVRSGASRLLLIHGLGSNRSNS
jgi:hypothetical protein